MVYASVPCIQMPSCTGEAPGCVSTANTRKGWRRIREERGKDARMDTRQGSKLALHWLDGTMVSLTGSAS